MKRKYLAIVLSLSMVFSVTSPVMASSDDFEVVEESSEDTFADVESEVSVSLEEDTETVEQDTNEDQDNIEIAQFSDIEDDFNDGMETALAIGDGETVADDWTPLEKESSISLSIMKVIRHYILNVLEQQKCRQIISQEVLLNGLWH